MTGVDLRRVRELVAPHNITLSDVDVVPAELFILVVEALYAAECELDQIDTVELELPDGILDHLKERHYLLAALQKVPEDWRVRLRGLYVAAEAQGGFSGVDGPTVPGFPEVQAQIAAAWEQLRRSALTDPGVDAALRQAAI